jgi:hypothetical protein
MGQQTSMSITNQQIPPLILTIHKDLFAIIALFMDIESQLALAHTCKEVYAYHKEKCRVKILAFLYSPLIDSHSEDQYYKIHERWLNKTGWAAVKVILKKISADSQSNNSYPIRALCLNEPAGFPNELNYENINALTLKSTVCRCPDLTRLSTLASLSFLRKFSNLKILRLLTTSIDDNMVSVISKLLLLKILSLNNCDITYDRLSNIFETCTTVEEIELSHPDSSDTTSIMFPPQVKRLRIGNFRRAMQVDLSRCIQLQSL